MRILYLDCGMGAAGDMLTAALLELLPDPAGFIGELNTLLPGVEYILEPSVKCGVAGTHVRVLIHGGEEPADCHGYPHAHDHDHVHAHEHDHTGMAEIQKVIEDLPVSDKVRADIASVFGRIAEAESRVHGVPVPEIHFHEVGTMDAVADVTAVCLLMERLAPDYVAASPVHVGSGKVRCAHGLLPVPAPATAELLKGVPIYGGAVEGELCTPTGSALLAHFADSFGEMPVLRVEAVGYGMGQRDLPAANCVRAILGEDGSGTDEVLELRCNVDDMTAEELGFAMERLFEAGALEVFTTPAGMKKNRPGTLLTVICAPEDRQTMAEAVFRHTTTIGIRESAARRYVLDRREEHLSTPWGDVRVKKPAGYGVRREKYEYEDLVRIARERGVSLGEARALVDREEG